MKLFQYSVKLKIQNNPSIVAISIAGMASVLGLLLINQSPGQATNIVPTSAEQERGMLTGAPFKDPIELNTNTPSHLKISLTALTSNISISGKNVRGTTYNGQFVGPTIHLVPGEKVDLSFTNKTASLSNLHFHGLHIVDTGSADNPTIAVNSNSTFTYHLDIPKNHPLGTSWYHNHQMCDDMEVMKMSTMKMSTHSESRTCTDIESQLMAGLSGTIIVGDIRQLLPRQFRNVTEHTIVLKDLQLNNSDQIVQNTRTSKIDANSPTVRLVNGLLRPSLSIKPGETQLWRLANEGADIFYKLQIPGSSFLIVGQDGFPVSRVTRAQALVLAPGKRYDVLVTAKFTQSSSWLKTMEYKQGEDTYPEVNLMQIKVLGNQKPSVYIPADLSVENYSVSPSKENLANEKVAQHRILTLGLSADGHSMFINGNQFNKDVPAFSTPAKVGTVEEWTIVNTTGEIHPFHTHTNYFQVISINGVKQPFTGLQSDIPVPQQVNGVPGKVVLRIDIADFAGPMMFHCHIAAHENAGMMSFINVVQ